MATTTTATKDMWVAIWLILGGETATAFQYLSFFESVDEAAEIGRLNTKDKVRL